MLELVGAVGTLYLLVAAVGYWLFLHRRKASAFAGADTVRRWWGRGCQVVDGMGARVWRQLATVAQAVARFAPARWRRTSVAVAMIALMLLAVAWTANRQLGWGFAGGDSSTDTRIGRLLLGDELVPPPSLPPEAFALAEAQMPMIASANRDWDKLDGRFKGRLIQLLSDIQGAGYPFVVIEGYRSPERQEMLADAGTHVTQARAFQSFHQYGLAADLAPVRDGKIVISERDPWAAEAYLALGQQAEALGLTWGGRWKMRDLMHVELHLSHRELQQMLPEAMAKARAEPPPGGEE